MEATIVTLKVEVIETRSKKFNLGLAVSSGLLLGLSFPPSPMYSLAYVAFIPFFVLMERLKTYSQLLRYSYLFLFVFHLITLYWTGGWTHGRDGWLMTSNAALLLVHPFFYMPSILLSFLVRKRTGLVSGLAAFAFLWVSYEYVHSLSEFSFPWITIGNSQAYDLLRSQIVEFTSTYGLSFLIVVFNATAFFLLTKMSTGQWKLRSNPAIIAFVVLIILYFGPLLYGLAKRSTERQPETSRLVRVGVVQPNFDPWEKWGEGFASKWDSYQFQLRKLIETTKMLSQGDVDLVLWPETAIPFPILAPRFLFMLQGLVGVVDSLQVPLYTGLHHIEYSDSSRASVTAQSVGNGMFAESYNSAVLIEPGRKLSSVYKKVVLVPFAERIPFASTLRFLIEPLKWNVGISSWGKGADTVVLTLTTRRADTTRFSGMICYESIYPNFVRSFVKKGAEFLVVITNDSWWGNTSGTYQHAAFASFRAIENRRWVIQCANGGISEFVDPFGNIFSPTEMYTHAEFVRHIEPRKELTFYTKHGDAFAQACLFCSVVFVILSLVRKKGSNQHGE